MSRIAIEQLVTTPSTPNYLSESAYDYTKWNLGRGIFKNPGVSAVDKYMAPLFDIIKPMEESTGFAAAYVFSINFSSTYDYVFGIENSTGATSTRRVHMWTVNKKTGARSWNGFITLTLASATAHTVRDFNIDRKQETTGTVSVAGTALTGVGTLLQTNRVAVGARIGFGSTDPTQITTWYRISAIASDTGATLATSAGTIAAGTPYVIEEYRPVYLASNATTTNGGIHLGKGITPEDFTSGGTTIALAAATDNVKAVYWIKDAAVQTNIVPAGMAIDFAGATPTNLDTYVLDLVSAGNYKFFTYNLRAALTVASGASTSAWLLATGNNPFTGTGSQNSNLCIATAAHGTGSGVKSLYMVTTTRVYRVPVTKITTTSTTVFSSPSDNITEVPPGSTNSYAATSALSTIEYMEDIDAFVVGTTHASSIASYVTQYVASGNQFNMIFGRNTLYLESNLKDSNIPLHFSNQATAFSFQDSGSTNLIYGVKQGTTQTSHGIYILPFGNHFTYASGSTGRLISPEISTPNAAKFYRVFANHVGVLGSGEFTKPTEGFKLYARTANIRTDATSGWTLLDETNDLSGFSGSSTIQFMVEFKTISELCIPSRILGMNVSYEDNTDDSHYEHSVGQSSLTSKRFAYFFKTAFGGTVPTLYIRLYDAVSGALLLTDNTASATLGTFEKSTNDGGAWTAYNTTDLANDTTYIRYTPTSLADNIKVRSVISQS